MEYLNIPAWVMDSAEFVGADQVERGTWLCLQRYCIGQENGGVIEDCVNWKDRQWQQLCRVTLREVRRKARLFRWEGNSLLVFYYPLEAEAIVQAKRLVAQQNGKAGGRPKKNPDGTQPKPTLVISEKAKGKGMEGNGMYTPLPPQEGGVSVPAGAVTDEELIALMRGLRPTWNGPPVLNHLEQRFFAKNRHVIEIWHPEDWLVVGEFLNAPKPRGSAYCQWDILKEFIKNSAGTLSQARSWKANQRPRFEVVGKVSAEPPATKEEIAEFFSKPKPQRMNS